MDHFPLLYFALLCLWLKTEEGGKRHLAILLSWNWAVYFSSFLVSSWWVADLIWLDDNITDEITTKNEYHLREGISYPIGDISNSIIQFHKHMQLVNRNKSSPHLRMYESVVLNPYSYIPKWVYLKRQQIYFGSTTKDWVHS